MHGDCVRDSLGFLFFWLYRKERLRHSLELKIARAEAGIKAAISEHFEITYIPDDWVSAFMT